MRPRCIAVVLACGLLAPRLGRAHGIADEIVAGSSQATPSNPSSWYFSERLSGTADVSSRLSLRLDATWTHDGATAPPAGANFRDSGGNIFLFSLGGDLTLNQHFALGAQVDYSPKTTTSADTSVSFSDTTQGMSSTQNADALLASRTGSVGGALFLDYDTAGDSNAETIVDGSVGVTRYDSFQELTAIWSQSLNRPVASDQVLAYCRTHVCSRQLRNALQPHSAALTQVRLGLAVTESLYRNTDATLGASYYLYDQDPTQVGYFSKITSGRLQTRDMSFGGGIPIAPYRFTVQPSLTERMGRLSAGLSFQFGQYVSDAAFSYNLTIGIKLQYKFSRAFKVWLKLSGQRDVDSTGTPSLSGYASLGTRFSF